jgi:hypothetical protein
MSDAPEYTLYYWPGFAGRGEFIRLAFAVVGQPLKDMARVDAPACAPAILKLMKGEGKKQLLLEVLRSGSRTLGTPYR